MQELTAINDYFKTGYKIYYWRTSNDIEVDFILYGERGIKAFEVKRTAKVTDGMLKGLKMFSNDYPDAELYFIYSGERPMRDGKIKIVPIMDALKELKDILGSTGIDVAFSDNKSK